MKTWQKRYQKMYKLCGTLLTLLASVVQQLQFLGTKGVEERERERESWGNGNGSGALCKIIIITHSTEFAIIGWYIPNPIESKKTKQLPKNTWKTLEKHLKKH